MQPASANDRGTDDRERLEKSQSSQNYSEMQGKSLRQDSAEGKGHVLNFICIKNSLGLLITENKF